MANIQNLIPFTKANAKEMGKKGGLASGITRKRKAYFRKLLNDIVDLSFYIDELDDIEYKDFIKDYTKEEQELIMLLFRPTKKQKKQLLKQFKL